MSALEAYGLYKSFGGIRAVSDVSISVELGEIVGLIGPNGAGKTTLLNLVSRLVPADAGRIEFLGRRIDRERPDKVARLGIARTFQIPKPLRDLTVVENVMVGALFGAEGCRSTHEARRMAMDALDRVDLVYKADADCQEISSGETKKMELARAIAMQPRFLVLDEPLAGVGERESQTLIELVLGLARSGCGILMIEHVMDVVWNVCERVIVMDHGEKVAEGTGADLVRDPKVVAAYLGEGYAARAFGHGSLTG